MSQKVHVVLVDDVDGGTADETVTFALDGVQYEIDLSAAHAEALRTALDPFVACARRLGGRGKVVARRGTVQPAVTRTRLVPDNQTLRAWATSQGIPVSPRGRISQEIKDRYMAETTS
jgi:hypothetical protein